MSCPPGYINLSCWINKKYVAQKYGNFSFEKVCLYLRMLSLETSSKTHYDYGSWGQAGQRGVKGEKWVNYNSTSS